MKAGHWLHAQRGFRRVSSAASQRLNNPPWTECEGYKDRAILGAAANPQPRWPWATGDEFRARFAEASQWRTHREAMKKGSAVEVE